MGLKKETIVAVVLVLLGVVCLCIGMATPYWYSRTASVQNKFMSFKFTITNGLWKLSCEGDCGGRNFDVGGDALNVVRALIIISVVASLGALICASIYLVNEQKRISTYKKVGTACLGCAVAALVLALIGCGIFAFYDESGTGSRWDSLTGSFDYSFYLTIIGGVLVVIGAAVRFAKK